jgi:lysozyme family protein
MLVSVCQVRVDAGVGVQTVEALRAENQTMSDRITQVYFLPHRSA